MKSAGITASAAACLLLCGPISSQAALLGHDIGIAFANGSQNLPAGYGRAGEPPHVVFATAGPGWEAELSGQQSSNPSFLKVNVHGDEGELVDLVWTGQPANYGSLQIALSDLPFVSGEGRITGMTRVPNAGFQTDPKPMQVDFAGFTDDTLLFTLRAVSHFQGYRARYQLQVEQSGADPSLKTIPPDLTATAEYRLVFVRDRRHA